MFNVEICFLFAEDIKETNKQLLKEENGGFHERLAKHVLEARLTNPSEMLIVIVRADISRPSFHT